MKSPYFLAKLQFFVYARRLPSYLSSSMSIQDPRLAARASMKQRASHPEAKASLRIAAPGTWDNIFQSCVTKTRGTVKPCVQPAAVAQQLAHSTHSPPHTHTHTHTDTHTRPSPITLVLDPELNVVANLIRHVHSHSHSH